jgi:16S rRNA (cytidine1402-2'-O)-methyltransferase
MKRELDGIHFTEQNTSMGTLYLVATPIGNLEDITLRALRILKEVNLIACEDTRHTSKLLNHFGIKTPRLSHHQHNEASSATKLLEILRAGKNVALVTDAGMPLISDPGYRLVVACRQEGIAVYPIPGASAAIAALSGSGLPADSFFFAGFLPHSRNQRRKRIAELSALNCTLVFYEAPHRILASLEDLAATLGPRKVCLARELTKIHEEWLRGTAAELIEILKARFKIQGEITLVVEGGQTPPPESAFAASIMQHLHEEMQKTGVTQKEALKAIARRRGISRREAYQLLQQEKDSE